MFNIKLPINFNSPYKALNIQDFWRRWHMTLSRFLRDYIYIPLGGNKKGSFRTYSNLLATFVIGGFWHGAGWTFLFWGFLHGIALIIHRVWSNLGFKIWTWLAWFITFNFVNVAWVFFRAKEWEDAIKVLKGMAGLSGVVISDKLIYKIGFFKSIISNNPELFGKLIFGSTSFSFIIAGVFFVLFFKNSMERILLFRINILYFIFVNVLFLVSYYFLFISTFDSNVFSEFIYFNF
jgi:hypothetical protein